MDKPEQNSSRLKPETPERDADDRRPGTRDPDEHKGAIEGDRPTDHPQHGNRNAPALDEQGLPNDPVAVCEDVIGANVDETEGG
jgi:hypothetical protein